MKKSIHIIVWMLFLVPSAWAQVQLDVEGDAQIDNQLTIMDSGSGTPAEVGVLYGEYLGNVNTNNRIVLANENSAANTLADISFLSNDRIYFSTNNERRMTLSPTGRLGIGTEAPSRLLDVRDDIYIGGGSNDYQSASEVIAIRGRSDTWYAGVLNESTQGASDFIIGLSSGATGMFHIENGGDVGIGTDNPIARLHLQDEGHQFVLRNDLEPANTWYVGATASTWNAGASKLIFDDDSNSAGPLLCLDGAEDGVSIGTAYVPPGYMLAVDGSIIAEEVVVELSTSWPDYVFEGDYELKTLDQVEYEIKQNGHLPGIPSAAQIETEGLELGEMQRRMMEKIEELTLYVIEINKENRVLKSELENLKNRMK